MAATAFGVGAVSQGGGRVKDGGEGRGKKKTHSILNFVCRRKINYFARKGLFIKSGNFSISQGKLDSFKEVRGR